MKTITAKCVKCHAVGPHRLHPAKRNKVGDLVAVVECEACGHRWERPSDLSQLAKAMVDESTHGL